jgi:hypothetical protein
MIASNPNASMPSWTTGQLTNAARRSGLLWGTDSITRR